MKNTDVFMQAHYLHLPFAGLGHDLAPAFQVAAKLAEHARTDMVHATPRNVRCAPVLAGYDLMLFLCREIRGC